MSNSISPIYPTREAYAVAVWASLDEGTQLDILADYGMVYGPAFLAAFTDNMDARHNGTVTFTRVEGGYTADDEAGDLLAQDCPTCGAESGYPCGHLL